MRRLVALPLLVAATGALAQTGAGGPDARILPPGGQVTDADTAQSRAAQVSAPTDARLPVTQVQAKAAPTAATGQVTAEGRSTGGSPQLGRRDRQTQATTPLSSRAEGRQTALVKVGGRDRCDPAGTDAAKPVDCTRVIETRSAEFTRPTAPVLSPEQRLLLDRDRLDVGGVRGAVQRVGRNDIDSNAIETQALAAITLGQGQAEVAAKQTAATTSPEADAAADAVLQIITAVQAAAPK